MANKSTVVEDLDFYIRDGVMDFKEYFIPLDAISFVKLNIPKDMVLIGYLITATAGVIFAFSKTWFIIVAGVLVIALSIAGMISGYLKNRQKASALVIQTNSGQTFLLKHKESRFLSDLMTILKAGRTDKTLFYHVDVQKGTILDGNDAAIASGFPIPPAGATRSYEEVQHGSQNFSGYARSMRQNQNANASGTVTGSMNQNSRNQNSRNQASTSNAAANAKKTRPRYYSASEYVRNHGVVTEVVPMPAAAPVKEEQDIFYNIEKEPASTQETDSSSTSITKKNWTDIEFLFFQRKTNFSKTDSKYQICEKLEDFAYHKDKAGMCTYFQSVSKPQLHTILNGFSKTEMELLMKVIH